MIKRYYPFIGGIERTRFISSVITHEDDQTQTITTTLFGKPGAFITIKITTYTKTNVGANYKIDGVTHVLNDTQGFIAGADGKVSFIQFLDVGTLDPGNVIRVILTIESTTIGQIGEPNTVQSEKTS